MIIVIDMGHAGVFNLTVIRKGRGINYLVQAFPRGSTEPSYSYDGPKKREVLHIAGQCPGFRLNYNGIQDFGLNEDVNKRLRHG